jgi:replication initiation protein RepC
MGELAPMRPSGLRRYSQFNAIVDKLAKGFEGQEGLSPSRLLNKLKRAAPSRGRRTGHRGRPRASGRVMKPSR